MIRKATAIWQGTLNEGQGELTTQSSALDKAVYSFGTRFQEQNGTNPEELIAAAHAACFSMALTHQLQKENLSLSSIRVDANVTLEKGADTWSIPTVHLDVVGEAADVDEEKFLQAAEIAKKNCPVSKLLNAQITMQARLESGISDDAHMDTDANKDNPTTDEAGVEVHQVNGMPANRPQLRGAKPSDSQQPVS